jgi:hypothetical protein
LTESTNAKDYLKKLRKRDKECWTYIGTNCPPQKQKKLLFSHTTN